MRPIIIGERNADCCLVQAVGSHDVVFLQREYEQIAENCNSRLLLAAFLVEDWNRDLSPWKAPAVFGEEAFGGGADSTLAYVLEEGLPFVKETMLPDREEVRWIIGGYSLAGLFALWASCQTNRFEACMAASPSVWFPGWMDYVKCHAVQADSVYLSLGDREEKTRNPVMSKVGNCIREQAELLKDRNCVLIWNKGNHFQNVDKRTADGFVWCVEQKKEAVRTG